MSEMEDKLNALLGDPESMGRIMSLAQQLSGGAAPPPKPEAPPQPSPPAMPLSPGGLDPQLMSRILPLLQEFSRDSSESMQLLYALRPFLKESKRDKVERAVKLARIIHIGKKAMTDWGLGDV